MNRRLHAILATLSILCAGAVFQSTAAAQCGGPTKIAFSGRASGSGAHLQLASWSERGDDRWGDERDEDGIEPIVGLWHVDLEDTVKSYSDKGYQAWHSDHTEFFNSTKAPGTGAVCQGVWEKIGRSTYQLNHFALGYNGTVGPIPQGEVGPTETAPAQIVHIQEIVTVDASHKHFQGKFSVEVYTYVGHNPIVSFSGPITARRVTIDSPLSSQ
ncbi:MAG TPA: hypothetical protein VGU67_01575 [Edaphobacter sp.]|nr:hypothetical protein [Edaphobacter sp.]